MATLSMRNTPQTCHEKYHPRNSGALNDPLLYFLFVLMLAKRFLAIMLTHKRLWICFFKFLNILYIEETYLKAFCKLT